MESVRVLVTGAGSGVGQGIIKALRLSAVPVTVTAGDIAPLNAGLYRAEEAVILPPVEAEGGLERIVSEIERRDIHIVMVGSEFDLDFFAVNRATIEAATSARVIVSPLDTVRIAADKWRTAEFLRQMGLPYAESAIPGDVEKAARIARHWGYPIVLKPRSGTASRHVHLIHSESALRAAFDGVPNPILQRNLAGAGSASGMGSEYTCSVFKDSSGRLFGPFTARRLLRHGTSWTIEVAPFAHFCPLLRGIGEKLSIVGSLNVQLIEGPEGPVPFEINARFSGTTAVRAHFGFNEPEMALRSFFLEEPLIEPSIRSGVAMRYVEEVFIDDIRVDALTENFPRGHVRPWF